MMENQILAGLVDNLVQEGGLPETEAELVEKLRPCFAKMPMWVELENKRMKLLRGIMKLIFLAESSYVLVNNPMYVEFIKRLNMNPETVYKNWTVEQSDLDEVIRANDCCTKRQAELVTKYEEVLKRRFGEIEKPKTESQADPCWQPGGLGVEPRSESEDVNLNVALSVLSMANSRDEPRKIVVERNSANGTQRKSIERPAFGSELTREEAKELWDSVPWVEKPDPEVIDANSRALDSAKAWCEAGCPGERLTVSDDESAHPDPDPSAYEFEEGEDQDQEEDTMVNAIVGCYVPAETKSQDETYLSEHGDTSSSESSASSNEDIPSCSAT